MRSLGDQLKSLLARWALILVALVLLGVSALFGGLRPADVGPVATESAGAEVAGAPWNVTITAAHLVAATKDLPTDTDGDHWLVVVATVEVTSDMPRGDLADVLRLHGVAGIAKDAPSHVLLLRDGTDVAFLNPGMPERLAFGWEQAAGAPPAKSIRVDVYNLTHRRESLTGGDNGGRMIWADPEIVATVSVPVEDRRS